MSLGIRHLQSSRTIRYGPKYGKKVRKDMSTSFGFHGKTYVKDMSRSIFAFGYHDNTYRSTKWMALCGHIDRWIR